MVALAYNLNQSMSQNRRFSSIYRLYGDSFAPHILHVIVVGVGGVGSWVAEGLVRSGIGQITLVDMDVVSESNINRQLPALSSTLGESKVMVMAQRLQDINPDVVIHVIDEFLTADNVSNILPSRKCGQNVVVVDCTDDTGAKLAMAVHCRFNKLKLVVSGGAGGKFDPTKITIADLKDVYQDPLLAKLRTKLREKGINRDLKEKFNIPCVFSTEPPKTTKMCESGLHCGGYGSSVAMTCGMAMVVVGKVLG